MDRKKGRKYCHQINTSDKNKIRIQIFLFNHLYITLTFYFFGFLVTSSGFSAASFALFALMPTNLASARAFLRAMKQECFLFSSVTTFDLVLEGAWWRTGRILPLTWDANLHSSREDSPFLICLIKIQI